jgi:DinB superfamily
VAWRDDLQSLSEYVLDRTRQRLGGLSDSEYFWEPAPACWTIRVDQDGTATVSGQSDHELPGFTTVAWRLWHLISCYGSGRNEQWLRGTDDGGSEVRCSPRPRAAAACEALDSAGHWWHELLSSLSEADLSQPLGPIAGPYGESDKASFVMHQIDEMIHHGAEVALLRDLFAATH